ncbi:phenoloxidase-activating factor 2 [Drosophila erecta]|uniref:Peptidase S1 domain-containing protein n=1 Tax=Drosophila erecta TaxID=7220 RepID=B3N9F6_DROER|nr:phenoloxidase-activating factor 2 [Drosophila erecta]EDV57413.1 uncharacterized protein Dere_GG24557 [Drosophila erecta]
MTLYLAFLATLIISFANCKHNNKNQVQFGTYGSNRSEDRRIGLDTFPWVVAVLDHGDWLFRYIGTGSLIRPNVVLTAAHILNDTAENDLVVRAGEWDISTTSDQQHVDLEVLKIVYHEQFNRFNAENNIALLILTSKFKLTTNINIIPLYRGEANMEICFFNGWGKVYLNSTDYPTILKTVHVNILSTDVCRRRLGRNRFSQICGESLEEIDDSGDGGAPVVCQMFSYTANPPRYAQVAIVNRLTHKPGDNTPTIYTNVLGLNNWINYQLRLNSNFRSRN